MKIDIDALRQIERDKAIDFNTVVEAFESAVASAYKRSNLSSADWVDYPSNTMNTNRVVVPITGLESFYRLVGPGGPAGPDLSISFNAGGVTVSWPALVNGYRLQSRPALNTASWTDIATTNNAFSEPASNMEKYYRLISP